MKLNSIEAKVLEAFISSGRNYYYVRQYFGSRWSNARIKELAKIYDDKTLFSAKAKDIYENEIILTQYQLNNLTISYENAITTS